MQESRHALECRVESAADALVAIFVASRAENTKLKRANNAPKMPEAQTTHCGFYRGRSDRLVRIATHPIMQVIEEIHSAIAAVFGDVGRITAAGDKARGAKCRHIDATRPSLSCWRSLRVPPLLDRPSRAQTGLAIEREGEKTLRSNTSCGRIERSIERARVV